MNDVKYALARGVKLPRKPTRIIAYSEAPGAVRFKNTKVGELLGRLRAAGRSGLAFGDVVKTRGDRWKIRILVKAKLVRVI